MNYDWQKIRLKEIGSVCMCKRILKHQTNTEKGIPFYKIGTFGKKADAFISEELYKKYKDKYNYPEKGDILISAAGTLGETIVYDGKPAYFQDSNIVWLKHDSSKAINKFLLYVYAMKPWEVPESSTVPRLYNNNILNTYILLPPLPEQEKIAEILGTWDFAIEKLTALIEQKKLLKKGLMQRLLTGKQRLPGFSTPWNKVKLGDACTTFSGGTPTKSKKEYWDKKDIKWISARYIDDDKITGYDFISQKGFENSTAKLALKGDIILVTRVSVGKIVICKETFAVNQDITVIRPKDASACFIYNILKIKIAEIVDKSQGLAIKGVTKETLNNVLLNIPSSTEQKAIADILSKADEEIDLLTRKLSALKEQKTGLMQQLLTGKIRVKVA